MTLPDSDLAPITKTFNNLLNHAANNNGNIDGWFYQKMNSSLGKLSKNPAVAPIAGDIRTAMNEAMQRYASPEDVSALSQAMGQYKALKNMPVDAKGNI